MKITGTTKITGVFGYPVKHSLSPVFQNAAFQYLDLDYIYIPIEVTPENIRKAIEGIRAMNFVGVNVTIPHKKNVIPYIDEIDREAEILGVVNTLVNRAGKIKGYSTDGCGFILSIKETGISLEDKTVFLLGAGGSAYAIAGAMAKEHIRKIYICNRTEERAVMLKEHLSEKFNFKNSSVVPFEEKNTEKYWKDIDILINTTSVGMKEEDPLLIDKKFIKSLKLVYDLIYNRKTELIKIAEKTGVQSLDGLSMLIYQGAVSFELWTGIKAPVDVMKRSVHKYSKR
ncbi:MAG: shikimate dehydrogenase [Candidatus Omnitrophica bacterium]|nr:shikimate dehydrogenase [Candidatus Omnitrophota bacterium]